MKPTKRDNFLVCDDNFDVEQFETVEDAMKGGKAKARGFADPDFPNTHDNVRVYQLIGFCEIPRIPHVEYHPVYKAIGQPTVRRKKK